MKHVLCEERFFGTDPEFAVVDNYFVQKVDKYNIHKLIPPAAFVTDFNLEFKVNKNGKREFYKQDCGSIIEDGAAFEFNVTPSLGGIHINEYVTFLRNRLEKIVKPIKYSSAVSPHAYAYFDPKLYWEGRDESFTDCVRFGCDPDYFPEFYMELGLEKEKPHEIDVAKHTGRYFGGHLHVQNMSDDLDCYVNQQAFLPIVFDFFVGCLNVVAHRPSDFLFCEKKRLEYYGHPGRGRLQKYSDKVNGYEYRPLSNFWLTNATMVNAICECANIASNIVENNMAQDFFYTFRDVIPEMWDACLNMDTIHAKKILDNCLEWATEKEIVFIDETSDVYRRIKYL